MSRSKHQQHRFFHSKRHKQPYPYRNRKIKPYGLKGWCNYGGEYYRRKLGEICVDLVNKKKARRLGKKQIKDELNDYDSKT